MWIWPLASRPVSNLANTQVESKHRCLHLSLIVQVLWVRSSFTWPTPAGATGLYDVQVVNGPSGVLNGNTYTVTVPANQTVGRHHLNFIYQQSLWQFGEFKWLFFTGLYSTICRHRTSGWYLPDSKYFKPHYNNKWYYWRHPVSFSGPGITDPL